jgi:hypothetical protein
MVFVPSWPFPEPRDERVFTLRQVLEGEDPLLCVVRDEGPFGWRFVSGKPVGDRITVDDTRIITLDEILEFDPSIWELADLPFGWRALRDSIDEPWRRESTGE